MQLPIDIDFRYMTKESLQNLIDGCRRSCGHFRRESNRFEALIKTAKNDMERDFYEGRRNVLQSHLAATAKAHNILVGILFYHF